MIDPRLQQLSYSSLLTLHSCPRKYELYKSQAEASDLDSGESSSTSVTYAFGHAVGAGIQASLLPGATEDSVIWQAFLSWEADLLGENTKQVKSFWHAISALQKFLHMKQAGYLQDWELVYHEGKPATELSFIITFPDGFVYRGFVDAVLRNTKTGKVMVLEIKTTAAAYLSQAQYKNSAQAIGYSIVLDHLFPTLSSYEVLYLIYKTKALEYEQMPFLKSYVQRARWIKELLLDIESIKSCAASGIFPMHGESCNAWYRDCEYLDICTLDNAHLLTPAGDEDLERIKKDNDSYQIKLTLAQLLESQLSKL